MDVQPGRDHAVGKFRRFFERVGNYDAALFAVQLAPSEVRDANARFAIRANRTGEFFPVASNCARYRAMFRGKSVSG